MDQKYIKCVLTKGFAVVEEKTTRPIVDWFPTVSIFDETGSVLGILNSEDTAKLYKTVYEMWPMHGEGKGKLDDREICSLGKYLIKVMVGWLHIIDPHDEDLETGRVAYAIMDKPAAKELIDAINQLV